MNGRSLQDFSDKASIEFQCPLPLPESRTGLLVKNVPSNVTQYQLFDRFSPFGPIYSCSVISKASSTEVTATVQFFLQQDAHMALQEMVSRYGKTNLFKTRVIHINIHLLLSLALLRY